MAKRAALRYVADFFGEKIGEGGTARTREVIMWRLGFMLLRISFRLITLAF
jgi:hypothetical protein